MADGESVYWSCGDGYLDYGLKAASMDEAIEIEIYESGTPPPAMITVYGWARRKPIIPPGAVLDLALEYLDEEYADPDEDYSAPTQAMKDAANAFHDVLISEYVPWACEIVETKTINVAEWQRGREVRNDSR